MNLEDIKVGEMYNVRVRVTDKTGNRIITHSVIDDDLLMDAAATIFFEEEVAAFSSINPYEPLRLDTINHMPETYPKYDPCRKFRKGDKVRVVEWNGRGIARIGMDGTVVEDEFNSKVNLAIDGWTKDVFYPACHLELVTPVEELEPFSVGGSIDGCILYKNGEHYAEFVSSIDAERACKLLNAEYRKEQ